jgi:protein arginine kinase
MSSPFLQIKQHSFWEKSDTPIWMASSFFLKRNLAASPFPQKLDKKESSHILTALKDTFLNIKSLDMPQFFSFSDIRGAEREFLCEHFLTTYDSQNTECQSGVIIDRSGTFLGIINGEDHLILESIEAHSGWKEAWKKLTEVEAALAKIHPFAFSNKFGYLTSELANLGTALTVQAFLHLPSLVQLDQIDDCLIRDLDDEVEAVGLTGTADYIGDIVIIENRFTLGLTEDHILEGVHKTATKLARAEKNLRSELKKAPDALIVDKISRAVGLLKHSYQIDTKEALNAISFIKLGIDLGWIEGLADKQVNRIFFELRRGHLSLAFNEDFPQEILAQKRAEYLQLALKTIKIKL